MGILEVLVRKEKKAKEVCIPDHAKSPDEPEEINDFLSKAKFRVEGLYELKGNTMVTGTVLTGKIGLGNKCTISNIECKVTELNLDKSSVDVMEEGQHGVVSLMHGKHPVVKVDDILEFE